MTGLPAQLMTRDASGRGGLAAVTAERDRLLEIVTALGVVSSSPASAPELMRQTVEQVMRLARGEGAVLELVDGDQLEYRAVAGSVADYLGLRLSAANSLSGQCVAAKSIMYSADTECDPRVDVMACRKISARSMLVVPLYRGADAIGVLKATSARPDAFDRIDEYALSLFAQFIGGVIARQSETDHSARLATEMERRALRDELTSLPNRAAWLEELERGIARARRGRMPLAVMYLDLDRFKGINDQHGHAAGDQVLQTFAAQLRGCMRASDFVARLAGDEFAVMVEGLTDAPRDVGGVAGKIIEAAREGTPWGGRLLQCLPSVGVAYQNGPDYCAQALMRHADEAMYLAKNTQIHVAVADCTNANAKQGSGGPKQGSECTFPKQRSECTLPQKLSVTSVAEGWDKPPARLIFPSAMIDAVPASLPWAVPALRPGQGTAVRDYSACMNSSAVTPACLSTPASVPVLSSRCRGTTQPVDPRRRTKHGSECTFQRNDRCGPCIAGRGRS